MTIVFHLLNIILIAALFRAILRERAQRADLQVQLDVAQAELETSRMSYKALMSRADDLARERVEANSLVNEVGRYISGIAPQLKELLARHAGARRALERIATFDGEQGGNYTETLKELAQEALKVLGLTNTGTVEEVARRIASEPVPAELAGKNIDNFVCDDNRKAKVDLSGQAASIRARLKETIGQLRAGFSRSLNGTLDDPLHVAQERLGTDRIAVDLVRHEGEESPSLAIVVEGRPGDFVPAAQDPKPAAGGTAIAADPLSYSSILSPVGKPE